MAVFHVPTKGPETWRELLADPVKHWRTGRSARTLAHCWEIAQGFPFEVQAALDSVFGSARLLLAIPEHQVWLPGGRAKSQNDIWCLAKARSQLLSIAVEGKVSETFGPTLDEWRDGGKNRARRLAFLLKTLHLSEAPISGPLRYQLLHRAASAVIEARRFNARHAVLLVHSFSPSGEWREDYEAFLGLYPGRTALGAMTRLFHSTGHEFWAAWVKGDATFLSR